MKSLLDLVTWVILAALLVTAVVFIAAWATSADQEEWVLEGNCVTHIYKEFGFGFADPDTTLTKYCEVSDG